MGSNPGKGGADGYIYLIIYRKKTSIRETKKPYSYERSWRRLYISFALNWSRDHWRRLHKTRSIVQLPGTCWKLWFNSDTAFSTSSGPLLSVNTWSRFCWSSLSPCRRTTHLWFVNSFEMFIYEKFFCKFLSRNWLFECIKILQWIDQEVQLSTFYIDFIIGIALKPWPVHCECAVKHNKW